MDRQSGFRGNTGHIVVRDKGCKDASLLQVIVRGVFYPDESGAAWCKAGDSHEDETVRSQRRLGSLQ
jgi:hypothetical protein